MLKRLLALSLTICLISHSDLIRMVKVSPTTITTAMRQAVRKCLRTTLQNWHHLPTRRTNWSLAVTPMSTQSLWPRNRAKHTSPVSVVPHARAHTPRPCRWSRLSWHPLRSVSTGKEVLQPIDSVTWTSSSLRIRPRRGLKASSNLSVHHVRLSSPTNSVSMAA